MFNLAGSFLETFWMGYAIIFPIYVVIGNVSFSIATTIFCLTFILTLWAIELFKKLIQRMNKLNDRQHLNHLELLIEWKRQHSAVIKLVDRFNQCFGTIITLIVFHGFISFISYTYMAIFSKEDNDSYSLFYAIINFFSQCLPLCMMIYAGQTLQIQVFFLNGCNFSHFKVFHE